MNSQRKLLKIKNKLVFLSSEVILVQKEIKDIKRVHQQFTFDSFIPPEFQRFLNKSLSKRNTDINEKSLQHPQSDKQNMGINANRRIYDEDKENMKSLVNLEIKKKNSQKSMQYHTNKHAASVTLNSLRKSDSIKDLKANLWAQLSEIKNIERKEQLLRRENARMKEYNSQRKKSYEKSLSKSKESEFCSLSKAKHMMDSNKQNIRISDNSKIEINIPITLEHQYKKNNGIKKESSILKCPKGHEYYEGILNQRNQPDGHGRLEVCCPEFPIHLNQDIKFYQGEFKEGVFHGFGTISYRGGVKYVGEFRLGRRQGKGSLYHNGKAETAKWQDDKFVRIM